jgi:serine protease Do
MMQFFRQRRLRPIYLLCLGLWAVPTVVAQSDQGLAPETPDESVLAAEAERVETIKQLSLPTIAIFEASGQGGGSGVLISEDGFALTNFHVVQPCGPFMQCGMSDGTLHDAVLVGLDPTGDVALIKLLGKENTKYPSAVLGDSDKLEAGDWCYVAGNPFLLATDFRPSISYGIISGVHRYQYPSGSLLEYADCIQTDAAVNPGNSGGPMFNIRGVLVGINGRCSFEKRGRVNVGVGYAISINQIKRFLGELHSGRIVDHATLGATAVADDQGRIRVGNILDTSDAYRRGLRYDDEIVSIDGRKIDTVNAFKNILGIYPAGSRVKLAFRRKEIDITAVVRLESLHIPEQLFQMIQQTPQEAPRPDDVPEPRPGEKKPPTPKPAEPIPLAPSDLARSQRLEKWYQERPGFANYHFNKIHLDRVWETYVQRQDLSARSQPWSLQGKVDSGDNFELILRDDEAFFSLPTGQYRADLLAELDQQLEPERSGGMLLAMSLWRRLAVQGPQNFGDMYYLGRQKDPDSSQEWDVVVGTHHTVEAKFFFDPGSGAIHHLECWAQPDGDPCVLEFNQYESKDDPNIPSRIRAVYQDNLFVELMIGKAVIPPKGKP